MRKKSFDFYIRICRLAFLLVMPILFIASQNQLNLEEEAIYAALLGDQQGTVIIADTTAGSYAFGWINVHNNMPAVSRITWMSYLARNIRSSPISPDMQLGVQYYLMGEEEMRDIFSHESSGVLNPDEGGWEELRRRYPDSDGITGLSRVGFNPAYTQALVKIGITRGSLHAESYLVCLEKHNGKWQIVEEWLFAVS